LGFCSSTSRWVSTIPHFTGSIFLNQYHSHASKIKNLKEKYRRRFQKIVYFTGQERFAKRLERRARDGVSGGVLGFSLDSAVPPPGQDEARLGTFETFFTGLTHYANL
jgi:hypothetical protein